MRKIITFIFLFLPSILPTIATALDLEDIYRKQLHLEQLIKDINEQMIARTSHGGDLDAAKAEINDLRCEQYFRNMRDFGLSTKAGRDSNAQQRFFNDRFDRCMDLSIIFHLMPYRDRLRFFQRYPSEIAGFGENPYGRIWNDIKSDSSLLKLIKSESAWQKNGESFIEQLDARLSSSPEK